MWRRSWRSGIASTCSKYVNRGQYKCSNTCVTVIDAAGAHVLPRHSVEHVGDVDELAVLSLRQLPRRELPERGDDRLHAALRARKVLHHFGSLLSG